MKNRSDSSALQFFCVLCLLFVAWTEGNAVHDLLLLGCVYFFRQILIGAEVCYLYIIQTQERVKREEGRWSPNRPKVEAMESSMFVRHLHMAPVEPLRVLKSHGAHGATTSNKQQATSNKQQATSNKQQATSNKQQATTITTCLLSVVAITPS